MSTVLFMCLFFNAALRNIYCAEWKLGVNMAKTKIVVFGRGKVRINTLSFKYGNKEQEIVDSHVYFGIKLS